MPPAPSRDRDQIRNNFGIGPGRRLGDAGAVGGQLHTFGQTSQAIDMLIRDEADALRPRVSLPIVFARKKIGSRYAGKP
jgi:hypothetical protein